MSTDMPPDWSDLIEGLTLLAQHPMDTEDPLLCGDKALYVMADDKAFTAEEISRLGELGFHIQDGGGFYTHRFYS